MKNFKMKDLMISINPERSDRNAVFNCEHHSKPDDTTGCTECTHNTTGDNTNCTQCTHNTTGDNTNCTQCTHNTTVTCKPHSKHEQKSAMNDSLKAIELTKLKKAIARLQENEYA
jgi:hypothetical protein